MRSTMFALWLLVLLGASLAYHVPPSYYDYHDTTSTSRFPQQAPQIVKRPPNFATTQRAPPVTTRVQPPVTNRVQPEVTTRAQPPVTTTPPRQPPSINGPPRQPTVNGPPRQPTPVVGGPPRQPGCAMTAEPPNPSSQCCGVDTVSSDRIIGGADTTPDLYPWSTLIEYRSHRTQRFFTPCSGFLISGRYVLSAAHCFAGKEVTETGVPVNVILGEFNTTNEGRDCVTVGEERICNDGAIKVKIQTVVVHKQYFHDNVTNVYDIALLRLAEMAPYTNFIRPICLPTADFTINPSRDLSLILAGWGAIRQEVVWELGRQTFRNVSPNVKQHVELKYRPLSDCIEYWGKFVNKNQLCIGGKDVDSCRGDSGSALMYNENEFYEAVGIVSFGPRKCALENVPAVYTNVFEYLDWIQANIRKLENEFAERPS